jgi:hypothetical protein
MAEVTGLRNVALPYPVYGAPFGIVAPLLDADGDPVSAATTPDSEVSLNGNTFADCTNEMVEIATNSGVYYLLLTAAEMTADVVTVIMKSATAGMKTTVVVLYPRKLVSIRAGTSASAGSLTSSIVLDASASTVDDFYNGMLCVAVIDTLTEARMISDYTGSTQSATVVPDWNVAPDNNDTFTIYRPDGVQMQQANVSHWNSLATVALPLVPATAGRSLVVDAAGLADANTVKVGPTASGTAQTARDLGASVLLSSGTGTGQLDFTSGVVKANPTQILGTAISTPATAGILDVNLKNIANATVSTSTAQLGVNAVQAGATAWGSGAITAASIAADAITAAKVADGTIDAATFATGAITAAAIAADAIGASELAADAVTEIQSGLATAAALTTVDDFLDTEIADIQARLPAALVSGRIDASIGAAAANTITASALAADAVTEIQSGLSTLTAAQVNTEADTALSDVGLTTTITGRIDAAVSTRATPAQVNTEVLDCLVTDTHAEISAVPAATSSLKDKLNWLFALARNKLTQTSTTQTLYADDASTPVGTSAVADDSTTASRAEWS